VSIFAALVGPATINLALGFSVVEKTKLPLLISAELRGAPQLF